MTDLSRRTFFKLTGAAVASASVSGPVAAALVAIEDPFGSWVPCDGRMLLRAAFPDLFATIGTVYGGSGNTFQIPDLRGRVNAIDIDAIDSWNHDLVPIMKVRRQDSDDTVPIGLIQLAMMKQ